MAPERRAELVLPDPEAPKSWQATPVALAGLAAAVVGVVAGLRPLGLVALVLFGVAGNLVTRARRQVRLQRRGDRVQVSNGPLSLPAGQGQIVVTARRVRVGKAERVAFEVAHARETDEHEVIAERPLDFLRARAFAEKLARFGGWDLVWRPLLGGDEEVRRPAELDASLSERLSAQPSALQPRPPALLPGMAVVAEPGDASLPAQDPTRAAPEGAFRVLWPYPLREMAFVVAGVGTLVSTALWLEQWLSGAFVVGSGLAGLLGALAARRRELLASRDEVRVRTLLFGRLPVSSRALPRREIESILVEEGDLGVQLRVASDRDSLVVPCPGGPLEGAWARYAIERALVSERAPLLSSHTVEGGGLEARDLCPRCFVGLERAGGDLDEHRCGSCQGRFLPPHGAERLVVEELGIGRELLRQIAELFHGPRLFCSGCGSRMRAVRLKGVDADLCFGCGALWLDRGELGELSSGRYEG